MCKKSKQIKIEKRTDRNDYSIPINYWQTGNEIQIGMRPIPDLFTYIK
tara:strand:+ start:13891 stop:14034 length:144 start_codon:yes stop_codon:yes gene_type:complete